MENRIIEIARKKARHQAGRADHIRGRKAGGHASIFFSSAGPPPPQARFPDDIGPERRSITTASTLAFVLATPLAPTPAEVREAERQKAPSRETVRTSKPRKSRKGATKATKLRPAAKASANAKKAVQPAKAARNRPEGLVADLAPPVIPSASQGASNRAMPAPVAHAQVAEQVSTPLPRARAVAVYRKIGLLDVVGYWVRSGWVGLARSFRGAPTAPQQAPQSSVKRRTSVAQLLAENAALRKEVDRLRLSLISL